MRPSRNPQPSPAAETGGEVLLALPGGGDLYYRLDGEMLLRHARQHQHLLLHHSARSLRDHRIDLDVKAMSWAYFAALVPLTALVFWLQSLVLHEFFPAFFHRMGDWAFFSGCALILLLAYVLHQGIVRRLDRETVNWGWECRKWVNVERRTYVVELRTFGKAPRTTQTVVSMDELALCGAINMFWESGSTWDIELTDAPRSRGAPRSHVRLHMGEGSKAEASAIAEQLAALWRVPFHWID